MITIREISWAAGIYEGEGNFSGTTAVIIQKDPWILHRLTRIFGFGSINRRANEGCYVWLVSGENARGFLLTIFTDLSPRRKAQILEFKKFFIDDKFKTRTVCRNKHVRTEENTKQEWNNKRQAFDTICLDCEKDNIKRYTAPMNKAAVALANIRGISKEEALEFLLNGPNKEKDDNGETIQ